MIRTVTDVTDRSRPMRDARGRLWTWCVAVLLCLELAKIAAFMAAGQGPVQFDAAIYWDLSRRMVAGDWLLVADGDGPEITRTPGYLLYVALFQAVCGTRALAAAIMAQHLLLLASALVTCWVCWRLNKTKRAIVLGLALSVLCISCHGVSVNLFSDTLFLFLLTLCIAVAVAWRQSRSPCLALALGVRWARRSWSSPLHSMHGYRCALGSCSTPGTVWPCANASHTRPACMAAVLLVAGPWLLRNQIYCGSPFLTKFAGRSLWYSCYYGNPADRLNPPLPFADGSATQEILRTASDVSPHDIWAVYKSLLRRGYSPSAADELMLAADKEGIRRTLGNMPRIVVFARLGFGLHPTARFDRSPAYTSPSASRTVRRRGRANSRKMWFRIRFNGDRSGISKKGGSITFGFRTRCSMRLPPESLSRRSFSCAGCPNVAPWRCCWEPGSVTSRHSA